MEQFREKKFGCVCACGEWDTLHLRVLPHHHPYFKILAESYKFLIYVTIIFYDMQSINHCILQ